MLYGGKRRHNGTAAERAIVDEAHNTAIDGGGGSSGSGSGRATSVCVKPTVKRAPCACSTCVCVCARAIAWQRTEKHLSLVPLVRFVLPCTLVGGHGTCVERSYVRRTCTSARRPRNQIVCMPSCVCIMVRTNMLQHERVHTPNTHTHTQIWLQNLSKHAARICVHNVPE